MHIDLWTLGLQAINVLVLVWLLARFLFHPVAAIVARRRQEADTLLADAEAARARAQQEAAEVTRQHQALAAEATVMRDAAQQEAAAARAAQLAQLQSDLAQARQDAEAGLSRERQQQWQQLEAQAGALAVEIARRLLARLPAVSVTVAMAQRLADDIAALPAQERDLLAAEAGQLQLVTAAPLDADAQDVFAAALTRALGATPRFDLRVDPTLLGGVELTGPHTLIRNSWRVDLDRIAHELAEQADAA